MDKNKYNFIKPEEYFTKEELADFFVAPLEKLEEFVKSDTWWNFVSDVDATEILAAISEKKKGRTEKMTNKPFSLEEKTRLTIEIF